MIKQDETITVSVFVQAVAMGKKILKDQKNVFHISIKILGSENIFERFKPTSFVIEAQTQQIVHLVTLTPTLPVEKA